MNLESDASFITGKVSVYAPVPSYLVIKVCVFIVELQEKLVCIGDKSVHGAIHGGIDGAINGAVVRPWVFRERRGRRWGIIILIIRQ